MATVSLLLRAGMNTQLEDLDLPVSVLADVVKDVSDGIVATTSALGIDGPQAAAVVGEVVKAEALDAA